MEDLDAAIADKRAELAGLLRDIVVARETSNTLLTHAKAIKDRAESDAAAIIQDARQLAQTALNAAGLR